MYQRLFACVVISGILHSIASANGVSATPFVDGRWSGVIETGPGSGDIEECWASTTSDDGTTLTLAKRDDGSWRLRLLNSAWRLPPFHRYDMVALVDFYPELHITAEAASQTLLEISDPDQVSLIGTIENGHTIALTAEGFDEKYDLEGSAKIIQRLRNCFSDND